MRDYSREFSACAHIKRRLGISKPWASDGLHVMISDEIKCSKAKSSKSRLIAIKIHKRYKSLRKKFGLSNRELVRHWDEWMGFKIQRNKTDSERMRSYLS